MKDARFLIVAMSLALSLVILTGCDQMTPTAPADETSSMLISNPQSSADMFMTDVQVEDATLENEVRVKPNPNDRGGERPEVGRPGPFDRLLKALSLTSDQALKVRVLLDEHKKCVEAALLVFKESNASIIEAANAARKDVLAQLEAGEITREEARAAIRSINESARAAIKNNPVTARVREMLKACDEEFLRQLASLLTDEQMAILKRYLDSRSNGGGTGNGPVGGRQG
jgi:hypothetical protein